jgi:hypothetical protein
MRSIIHHQSSINSTIHHSSLPCLALHCHCILMSWKIFSKLQVWPVRHLSSSCSLIIPILMFTNANSRLNGIEYLAPRPPASYRSFLSSDSGFFFFFLLLPFWMNVRHNRLWLFLCPFGFGFCGWEWIELDIVMVFTIIFSFFGSVQKEDIGLDFQ